MLLSINAVDLSLPFFMVLNSGSLIAGTPVLRYPYQGNVIFQNIRI